MHGLCGLTTGKSHLLNGTFVPNLYLQPFAQGIYNTGTNAVQTAGYFISAAAELTAGMQHGKYHFKGRNTHLGMNTGGNTTSVITDADLITGQNGHFDVITEAGQCLVDGVVYDLIDQMMQASGTGRTDIHTGTFTYSLKAFQHLNLIFIIGSLDFFVFRHNRKPPIFFGVVTFFGLFTHAEPSAFFLRTLQQGFA